MKAHDQLSPVPSTKLEAFQELIYKLTSSGLLIDLHNVTSTIVDLIYYVRFK
jgi:hypothetical protein